MYEIGNFIVYGDHEDDPGGLSIKLLPYENHRAYAWWSESTRDIIIAMEDLPIKNAQVLDFGCGASAILALVAAKMGAKKVVACEIHPDLVVIAELQIKANNLSIPVVTTDKKKYDVIIANIGDDDLVEELKKRSKHGVGTNKEGDLLIW